MKRTNRTKKHTRSTDCGLDAQSSARQLTHAHLTVASLQNTAKIPHFNHLNGTTMVPSSAVTSHVTLSATLVAREVPMKLGTPAGPRRSTCLDIEVSNLLLLPRLFPRRDRIQVLLGPNNPGVLRTSVVILAALDTSGQKLLDGTIEILSIRLVCLREILIHGVVTGLWIHHLAREDVNGVLLQ